MALTRKMLKGMGLTEEQADTIIEAHAETVDGLKERLSAAEAEAKKADDLQKELDGLKAKGGEDFKARAEKAEQELKDYKAQVAARETKAAKESAAKAYFEAKNITGSNLSIALRGARDEIASIELDDKGGIKDTSALDALVGGEFAGLVVKSSTRGATTATPPAGNNGGGKMTRDEIYKRDASGRFLLDATQRQKALSEIIAAEQQKG